MKWNQTVEGKLKISKKKEKKKKRIHIANRICAKENRKCAPMKCEDDDIKYIKKIQFGSCFSNNHIRSTGEGDFEK